ncbi:MAG: antitoxin Xre-like helix-turn-helix domain-containing protein [Duganella sp.]
MKPKTIAKQAAAPSAARIKTVTAAGQDFVQAKTTAPAATRHSNAVVDGTQLYRAAPQARIAVIRQGIPASMVSNLSSRMGMSKEILLSSLGLSRVTISRKEKDATVLSKDELIVPDESNILINPHHGDAARIAATTLKRWIYAPRFLP